MQRTILEYVAFKWIPPTIVTETVVGVVILPTSSSYQVYPKVDDIFIIETIGGLAMGAAVRFAIAHPQDSQMRGTARSSLCASLGWLLIMIAVFVRVIGNHEFTTGPKQVFVTTVATKGLARLFSWTEMIFREVVRLEGLK